MPPKMNTERTAHTFGNTDKVEDERQVRFKGYHSKNAKKNARLKDLSCNMSGFNFT